MAEPLEVGRRFGLSELSHLDRAALLSFVQQLNLLQRTSGELLQHDASALLVSAAAEGPRTRRLVASRTSIGPHAGIPAGLLNGLLPAVCFVVAYFLLDLLRSADRSERTKHGGDVRLVGCFDADERGGLIPLALVAIGGFVAPVTSSSCRD